MLEENKIKIADNSKMPGYDKRLIQSNVNMNNELKEVLIKDLFLQFQIL